MKQPAKTQSSVLRTHHLLPITTIAISSLFVHEGSMLMKIKWESCWDRKLVWLLKTLPFFFFNCLLLPSTSSLSAVFSFKPLPPWQAAGCPSNCFWSWAARIRMIRDPPHKNRTRISGAEAQESAFFTSSSGYPPAPWQRSRATDPEGPLQELSLPSPPTSPFSQEVLEALLLSAFPALHVPYPLFHEEQWSAVQGWHCLLCGGWSLQSTLNNGLWT